MHYVLMIHAAESRFATMTPAEGETVMQRYGDYTRQLMETGRAGDCAALAPSNTATRVQVREGKRSVQDGPFADSREQLAGYYSFDGQSIEELQEWAAKIPDASGGHIELRPTVAHGGPATPPPQPKEGKEYILLIYEAESNWAGRSEAEVAAIMQRYLGFSKETRASGNMLAGEQLQSARSACTVSVEGKKRVVKDGPYADTREQLAGYYRMRARDLDEAIALAARIPAAETGTIEIRPVADTSAYM